MDVQQSYYRNQLTPELDQASQNRWEKNVFAISTKTMTSSEWFLLIQLITPTKKQTGHIT